MLSLDWRKRTNSPWPPFVMQKLILGEESLRRPVEILLVENSATDVLLATEALNTAVTRSHLYVVSDGVEATAFLSRSGAYTEAPRPDLILLDLNLPRKDGRELLSEIKGNPCGRSYHLEGGK